MKMKLPLIVFLFIIIFSSCKNDSENIPIPATEGSVTFTFKNVIDGAPLQTGTLSYVNEAGNTYSVDVLKYYISNVVFIGDDMAEHHTPNYELIDQSSEASQTFSVNGIPNGKYTGLRFYVGVDSTRNHSGIQSGDLDPVNGMLWDWFSGYVYFKHEGNFIDSTGTTDIIHFHYGTLKALVTVEMPIDLTIEGNQRSIDLAFNLNKVYRSPNVMNFNGENFHQSTGPGENGWLQLIKENFNGAFSITIIE
jgi:hypothetical protein